MKPMTAKTMNALLQTSKARLIRAACLAASMAVSSSFLPASVAAQDAPPGVTPERIRKLEESVNLLQEQNRRLQRRVDELESRKPESVPAGTSPQTATSGQVVSNPPPAKVDNEVRLFWKDGLSFETKDKKTFKGKLGAATNVIVLTPLTT